MLAMGAALAPQTSAQSPPPPDAPVLRARRSSSAERLDAWTLDGSGAWTIRDGLLCSRRPASPPVNPPAGGAGDPEDAGARRLSIEVELRSDAPEDVIRRDLLLVAGWQSPTRLYYVHLSAIRDDVHNGIFVVDNADRRRIDDRATGRR